MFKLSVVVAAGLLLCGASGYAIAQSGSAGPKTIKACAKKNNGALRLGKKCRKGERRVTWAARGPGGLPGPAGQPGAAGQDGEQGAQLNYGNRRGRLLSLERGVGAGIQANGARCENKMCGGTDGDEFGESLDEAEVDDL